eukprot:m.132804 g.132804  ORF g.132804 m.132804 type:complete len:179 (+) comp16495_c1_seq1:2100-2636(+)
MSERLSVANAAATASAAGAEAVSPRRSSVFNTRSEPAAASHVDHCDNPAEPTKHAPRRPLTPLENTFRMTPDKKFSAKSVEDVINTVLASQLEEETYDVRSSRQMTKTLCTLITNRVKELGYNRYKIVTYVSLCQRAEQGMRVASRCLFDEDTDAYASGSFKNASLIAVATVYGLYYE